MGLVEAVANRPHPHRDVGRVSDPPEQFRNGDPRRGWGRGLVGLGERDVVVRVPAALAHGTPDPARVRRVRVVEVVGGAVVVDTNHPRCGQSVELEVAIVAILGASPEVEHWGP